MTEETPNNIIKFPQTNDARRRMAFHAAKDKLIEKSKSVGSKYLGLDLEDNSGPEPIKNALDDHIKSRVENLNTGLQEGKDATILSMRDHQIKKNKIAGDASVDKMINSDPTKDD